MLTSIQKRDTSEIGQPSQPLDHAILGVLTADGALEPRQILARLSSDYSLQQLHARLRILVRKGVIMYRRIPDGPVRGPGAGEYFVRS